MFLTFGNLIGGVAAALGDEVLTRQTIAGRTDAVCAYLDAIGLPCKGQRKPLVLAHLGAIVAGAADLKGTDSFCIAVPLFAAACSDMLGKGDRTRADAFDQDYAAALKLRKETRAAARVKAAAAAVVDKVQGEAHPTVQAEAHPTVQADVQPTVQADVQPTVQADVQPTVQADVQPTVQADVQPTVQADVQPTVQADPVDAAIALITARIASATLTDAQLQAVRNMLELLAIPA